MRPLFVALLFLLALDSGTAFARIGETLDQCIKRYGKATRIPLVYNFTASATELAYYNFQKNGIGIQVGFLNGKAGDLSFQHVAAPDATTPAQPLSQVEIDMLLKADSADQHWNIVLDGVLTFFPDGPAPSTRYGMYRQRDDGVLATVDGNVLHIFTPEWMNYINTRMKTNNAQSSENQKKNLEGF